MLNRAKTCMSCFKRVNWTKGARHLPQAPWLVRYINDTLHELGADAYVLDRTDLPSSFCGSCVKGIKRGLKNFNARLATRMVPTGSHTRCRGQGTCSFCNIAGVQATWRVRPKVHKRESPTKTDEPEHDKESIATVQQLGSPPAPIKADRWVLSALVAGIPGRRSIMQAK